MSFELSNFVEATQMALAVAKLGRQERLNQIPRHRWPDRPSAHADHVHVIVFDALARRKVVVNQSSAHAENFVGADRCPHTAAADGHAAFDFSSRYGMGERYDEIRIIVIRIQTVRSKVNHLVSRGAEMGHELLL